MASDWSQVKTKIKYAKKKDIEWDPDKVNYSDWFLTINTNVPVKKKSQAVLDDLREALENILSCVSAPQNLGRILFKVDSKGQRISEEVVPEDFVGSQNFKHTAFEHGTRGSKGNRFHMHTILETKHHHRMQMDVKELRKVVDKCREKWNLTGNHYKLGRLYLNVKFIPSRKGAIDYLSKQVGKTEAKREIKIQPPEFWENFEGGNYPGL